MLCRAGFTLIELSIVLVIIGLIAGAVLIGRDLIEAATIRAQVTQFEKYTAAANTFRTKYGFLPGDLPADQAAQLGTGFFDRTGAWGDGDGDGYIQTKGFGTTVAPGLAGETALLWTDLAAASLVEGAFVDSQDLPVTAVGDVQISEYLPKARIGKAYITIYGQDDGFGSTYYQKTNNFELVAFLPGSAFGNIAAGFESICPSLTPLQALAIDQKMDDGLPLSGRVQGMLASVQCFNQPDAPLSVFAANPAFWASGGSDCIQNTAPVTYKTADSQKASIQSCSLRIRAGF